MSFLFRRYCIVSFSIRYNAILLALQYVRISSLNSGEAQQPNIIEEGEIIGRSAPFLRVSQRLPQAVFSRIILHSVS